MKTVTAKDFQLRQSQLMKEVAEGTVYQVTYHGKPWVELHPSGGRQGTRVGSIEAFEQSLQIRLTSTQLPQKPNYKELRKQQLLKAYLG